MEKTTVAVKRLHRFSPTDTELIEELLVRKAMKQPLPDNCDLIFRSVYGDSSPWDVFTSNHPWLISDHPKKKVLYCFSSFSESRRRRRRTAGIGTWTGNTTSHNIRDSRGNVVGLSKQFLFKPNDESKVKGKWIMHEYSLKDPQNYIDGNCILCKITAEGIAEDEEKETHPIDDEGSSTRKRDRSSISRETEESEESGDSTEGESGLVVNGVNSGALVNVEAFNPQVASEVSPGEAVPLSLELRLGPPSSSDADRLTSNGFQNQPDFLDKPRPSPVQDQPDVPSPDEPAPLFSKMPTRYVVPPLHRFRPTEIELIEELLRRKVEKQRLPDEYEQHIIERSVYGDDPPWDVFNSNDPWEFFENLKKRVIYCFSPVSKHVTASNKQSLHCNRRAGCGSWRLAPVYRLGKSGEKKSFPEKIRDLSGVVIGYVETSNFNTKEGFEEKKKGKGIWSMKQYSLKTSRELVDQDWVLCRVTNYTYDERKGSGSVRDDDGRGKRKKSSVPAGNRENKKSGGSEIGTSSQENVSTGAPGQGSHENQESDVSSENSVARVGSRDKPLVDSVVCPQMAVVPQTSELRTAQEVPHDGSTQFMEKEKLFFGVPVSQFFGNRELAISDDDGRGKRKKSSVPAENQENKKSGGSDVGASSQENVSTGAPSHENQESDVPNSDAQAPPSSSGANSHEPGDDKAAG